MIRVFNKSRLGLREIFLLAVLAFYLGLNIFANTVLGSAYWAKNFINVSSIVIRYLLLIDLLIDVFFVEKKIRIITIVTLALGLLVWGFSQNWSVLTSLLLVLVYSKIRLKSIIKTASIVFGVSLLLVISLAWAGVINNVSFNRGENIIRYGLGFGWTTIGPTIFMLFVLMVVYLRKSQISYIELLAFLAIDALLYYWTNSRLDFALTILIIVIATIAKIFRKRDISRFFDKNWVGALLSLLPFIFVLASIFISLIYDGGSWFWARLNSFTADRLRLWQRGFRELSLTPFGQPIAWRGWNQDTFFHDGTYDYFYIDNSYLQILFSYGVFALLFITLSYSFLIKKSLQKKDYYLLFVLVIISLNALLEPYLAKIPFNVFFLALGRYLIDASAFEKPMRKTVEDKNIEERSVMAIVVTYRRKELLRNCLEALLKTPYDRLHILIIDNHSQDGTKEYIADLIKGKVTYLDTGKNLGGAGGFSFGMQEALKRGADYMWLMDDDCLPNEGSLSALLEEAKAKNGNFGFLASKVLWKDGNVSLMNVPRRNLFDKKFVEDETTKKVKLASFVSFFVNAKAAVEVGLPIKDFFIWGDDWEYSNRISALYDCYYVGSSVVTHCSAKNLGVDIASDESDRLDRYYYAYRNEGYFYRQSGIVGKSYYLLKIAYHLFKVALSKSSKKKEKFKIIKKGFFDHLAFYPHIQYVYRPNDPLRVAEFLAEPLYYGGQEAFILNNGELFKDPQTTYSIVSPFHCHNPRFERFAEKENHELVAYNHSFNKIFRKRNVIDAATTFFSRHQYEVAHIHSGSTYSLYNVAKIAKQNGVKKVIVHSHSTGKDKLSYRLIRSLSDRRIDHYADLYFACSQEAGEWRFPKTILVSERFQVIKNGIKLDLYRFDEKIRSQYRKELGIKDELTIIQIGRFDGIKNYSFTVRVLKRLFDKGIDFKFIGIGEDEGYLKEFLKAAEDYGLSERIIHLEKKGDIPNLLMAADVGITPSIFEGLSIAGIEYQASGLPSLFSTNVPGLVAVTNLASFLPLEEETWANAIEKLKKNKDRSLYVEKVKEAGFDSRLTAERLERIYHGDEN